MQNKIVACDVLDGGCKAPHVVWYMQVGCVLFLYGHHVSHPASDAANACDFDGVSGGSTCDMWAAHTYSMVTEAGLLWLLQAWGLCTSAVHTMPLVLWTRATSQSRNPELFAVVCGRVPVVVL